MNYESIEKEKKGKKVISVRQNTQSETSGGDISQFCMTWTLSMYEYFVLYPRI